MKKSSAPNYSSAHNKSTDHGDGITPSQIDEIRNVLGKINPQALKPKSSLYESLKMGSQEHRKSNPKTVKKTVAYNLTDIESMDSVNSGEEKNINSHSSNNHDNLLGSPKANFNSLKQDFLQKGMFSSYDDRGAKKSIQKRPQSSGKKSVSPTKKHDMSMDQVYFQTYDNRTKVNKENRNSINRSSQIESGQKKKILMDLQKKEKDMRYFEMKPDRSSEKVNKNYDKVNSSFSHPQPGIPKSRSSSHSKPIIDIKPRMTVGHKQQDSSKHSTGSEEARLAKAFLAQSLSQLKHPAYCKTEGDDYRLDSEIKMGQESQSDNSEFTSLNEKEIQEMNSSLITYYDVLIERDQANALLLKNAKENSKLMIKEFMKYYYIAKDFGALKDRYEQEFEKLEREKQLLELNNNILIKENQKLQELNQRYVMGENFLDESMFRTKDSRVNKSIHEGMNNEKKLLELLKKREEMILTLKNKESKYIKLIWAMKSRGIDVDSIYAEEVKNKKTPEKFAAQKSQQKPMDYFDVYEGEEEDVTYGEEKKTDERLECEPSNSEYSYARIQTSESKGNPLEPIDVNKDYHRGYDDMESSERYQQDFQGFKLDLSRLNPINKPKAQVGFHDEMLNMLPDMSSSWQREFMKDKTFVHK